MYKYVMETSHDGVTDQCQDNYPAFTRKREWHPESENEYPNFIQCLNEIQGDD
ncbi:hypothetical protein L873DRAFT_1804170 [Choiromyces venosus 120613-1]|uniref:Uncharacterized protein n=1 Tax=Choiromyces venosus 120613-1 TaxID=1336337 RepID=A0A3N4JSG6_9PEZI|nr:hypothetical protein L873DRAFT_1804170 [Choiromyces venosus 120613-1]